MSSQKKALISGINGQDGSYLAELLLSKGYDIYGTLRRSSVFTTERIDHIKELNPEVRDKIFYADLTEGIENIIYNIKPDEIYNLAAQSHVRVSFDKPVYTGMVNAIGVARILEAIRRGIQNKILDPNIKYYQASSSEMFGTSPPPQNLNTPFNPVSPYGCAKLYAYHLTKSYRYSYNMFASNGILFNHESPRRGVTFVTRKITRAVARIKLGLQEKLQLGNLDALRDWGHSKDYVIAIHKILQFPEPNDWIVATGEMHSVKEFVIAVFKYFDLDWEKYVVYEKALTRPVEVPALLGEADRTRKLLDWKPEYNFDMLVKEMVEHDYKLAQKEIK